MNAYDFKCQRYKMPYSEVSLSYSSPGTVSVISPLRTLPERYQAPTGKKHVLFVASPADQHLLAILHPGDCSEVHFYFFVAL